MLKAKGAHALYIEGLSIRTETVASARGRRPWVPDRAIVKSDGPSTSGRPYARGDKRDEDAGDADKRFDGNPEE